MTNKLRWRDEWYDGRLEWRAKDPENNLEFRFYRDRPDYGPLVWNYHLTAHVLSGEDAGAQVSAPHGARSLDRIKEIAEEERPRWAQMVREDSWIRVPKGLKAKLLR